jgi:hypothetical protein
MTKEAMSDRKFSRTTALRDLNSDLERAEERRRAAQYRLRRDQDGDIFERASLSN